MRIRLLFILFLFPGFKVLAQQRFIDFNISIPNNVSSSISNQYILSDEHVTTNFYWTVFINIQSLADPDKINSSVK